MNSTRVIVHGAMGRPIPLKEGKHYTIEDGKVNINFNLFKNESITIITNTEEES